MNLADSNWDSDEHLIEPRNISGVPEKPSLARYTRNGWFSLKQATAKIPGENQCLRHANYYRHAHTICLCQKTNIAGCSLRSEHDTDSFKSAVVPSPSRVAAG